MRPQYGYWHPWAGWHRRWCNPPYAWPWAFPSKEEETAILEEQTKILERELESMKRRLEELKKQEVKNA